MMYRFMIIKHYNAYIYFLLLAFFLMAPKSHHCMRPCKDAHFLFNFLSHFENSLKNPILIRNFLCNTSTCYMHQIHAYLYFSLNTSLIYFSHHRYRILDEYPCEPYTDVYLIKYHEIESAKLAKNKLDNHYFFSKDLHVCYAPEFESVSDTREKLNRRRTKIRKFKKSEFYFTFYFIVIQSLCQIFAL